MKTYKIHVKSSKLKNKDFLLEQINNLEDGTYNVIIEKSEVGQAKYFFYRDVIAEYLGYGTKKEKEELHNTIKLELLPNVFKNPDNLNTEDYERLSYSTKFLSDRGWITLINDLSIWAMSKFDIVLN